MTKVVQARPYGRFMEKESNLRRKNFLGKEQGSNFLGYKRGNLRPPIQFIKKRQSWNILKNDFLSRADPSILKLIENELIDQLHETN